ncbi:hypothetical protein BJ878DRAFT_519894 [Calycina marina]|uniref:Uncharacterized protein n=1 Tax=Calycina marina TaxID=1763456 RepID=A0A9P7YXN3_9HELO|nr:hypothetical protein BJ878DRAFT_519894 [Calycina marina]
MGRQSSFPHRKQRIEELLSIHKPIGLMGKALVYETQRTVESKQEPIIMNVLLDAGADVDAENGDALRCALVNPTLTNLILSRRPSPGTVTKVLPFAATLPEALRYNACKSLIDAGARGPEIDQVFANLMKEGDGALPMLQLLAPKINANFGDGMALCLAIRQYLLTVITLIFRAPSITMNMVTKNNALNEAIKLTSKQERHDMVAKLLASVPADSATISKALIVAVDHKDITLMELLLRYGAAADYAGGLCVTQAAGAGDTDILKALVSTKPTFQTLSRAWNAALLLNSRYPAAYYPVLQILLNAGFKGEAVHIQLIKAVELGDSNVEVVKLLLGHNASVEFDRGMALATAASQASFALIDLLLTKKPSEKVLIRSYCTALKHEGEDRIRLVRTFLKTGKTHDNYVCSSLLQATEQIDVELVGLLLDHDVYDQGQSLYHAAQSADILTTSLLLEAPRSKNLVSEIFEKVVLGDEIWKAPDGIQVCELFLKRGVTQDNLGKALVLAVTEVLACEEKVSSQWLDMLLSYGANVDFDSGKCLQLAACDVNVSIVQRLLSHTKKALSKAMALPYIFVGTKNATAALQIINAFEISCPEGEGLEEGFIHPESMFKPVLFMALESFPHHNEILNSLLNLRCSPNVFQSFGTHDMSKAVTEKWSLLCWAIAEGEKAVSDAVIKTLIDRGANVNPRKTKSGLTPLVLAIENGREDIVKHLIAHEANVSVTGPDDESLLVMATKYGNTAIMQSLLKANADIDDGSLHDAARELNCDAMRLLMRYGHCPDYPSDRHGGRYALAELCLNAVNIDPSPSQSQLEAGIQCLVLGTEKMSGADLRLRDVSEFGNEEGKTIFHHALDSANPVLILTAMLKTMWEFANKDAFLYNDKTYTYSLTKYVEKDIFKGPLNQKEQVLFLLRQKRVTDKFWAFSKGSIQPEDSCGEPDDVKVEAERQRYRRLVKAEQEEDAMAAVQLQRLTAMNEIEIGELKTSAQAKNMKEIAAVEQQLLADRETTKLGLDATAERQRLQFLNDRQTSEAAHSRALADHQREHHRMLMADATSSELMKNQMQIDHQEKQLTLDNTALGNRLRLEGGARSENDALASKMHERELERIRMGAAVDERNFNMTRKLQSPIGPLMIQIGNGAPCKDDDILSVMARSNLHFPPEEVD